MVGVIAMLFNVAGVTVSCALPLAPLNDAVIVSGPPALTDVARPFVPAALLTVATANIDELQLTCDVTSSDVPSMNRAVAPNDCVVPSAIDAVAGRTSIIVSGEFATVSCVCPVVPAMLAVMFDIPT